MTGKVAGRIGLAGTGLLDLTPSGLHAWLDRVRDGDLTASQHRATLLLVYRTWLVAFLLKALGSGWDVAWHFRFLRDDFAPPHLVNLAGDGIAIALVLGHWYTRFAMDSTALRLALGGTALFIIAAPVDVINHRINGLDITSWSITHFSLYAGTGILLAGVIRGFRTHADGVPGRWLILGGLWFFFLENVWFPNQHQEYGVEEIAAWDRGQPYAEQSLLEFAAAQIGRPVDRVSLVQFSLPVPDWVYPLWAVAAAVLTLVVARRSVGLPWTATTLAAAYLAWRCLLWLMLAGAGFPTSAVPFLLLAGAVAVDLATQHALSWPTEAGVGAVLATGSIYLAGYVQSYLMLTPPIGYWSAPAAALLLGSCWAALARLRAQGQISPALW